MLESGNESYVIGASAPPLIEQTIGQALSEAADQHGESEAIVSVHQGVRVSYRELNEQAEMVGAGLLSLGLEPGELLAEVELDGLGGKRPLEMSGGQQQRVAVARAIASRPRIVLADEPTANLDSDTARHLLELMEQLNREHEITFLFSTHDPLVMERARRSVRLKDGRIVADEPRAA